MTRNKVEPRSVSLENLSAKRQSPEAQQQQNESRRSHGRDAVASQMAEFLKNPMAGQMPNPWHDRLLQTGQDLYRLAQIAQRGALDPQLDN